MPADAFVSPITLGLLPEPERRPASFITSTLVNLSVLAICLYIGMTAKSVLERHHYEQTVLIFPSHPLSQPKLKVSPPAKPRDPQVEFKPPKIKLPRIEQNPEPKPIPLESKLEPIVIRPASKVVILAPQPKAVLAAAPAQDHQIKPSVVPLHLGDAFGVTPNSNASRPATISAIGNPYGGLNGPAGAPRGVVGSTGIGNGSTKGSSYGNPGAVASVRILGLAPMVAPPAQNYPTKPTSAGLEILSKPPVQYTAEARQLRIQGDVIVRVTFTASGQVLVRGIVHGLGHGLDEEAVKIAEQIHFRPATLNGQPADTTTTITITFQLA